MGADWNLGRCIMSLNLERSQRLERRKMLDIFFLGGGVELRA